VVARRTPDLKAYLANSYSSKLDPDHKRVSAPQGTREMDYDELGETTMDATKRTLLQVAFVEQMSIADEVFASRAMTSSSAKHFIQTNAKDAALPRHLRTHRR